MKIMHIKKMPKGRYRITLDNGNELILYEDIIINNMLLIGKDLNSDLYSKIVKDNYEVGAYQQALQHIGIRMRSENELRKYLLKKEYEIELIDDAISKLKRDGYIDDYAFAAAFVNDKLNLSNDGIIKISKTLINYGINEDIIKQVLANVDEKQLTEKINKLISKQLRLNTKYTGSILKGRILNYLINLGYDSNLILKQLDNYDFDKNGDVQREYQKLYKKYGNKYSGYKLDMVIKQKLYQKGYNISDIDINI